MWKDYFHSESVIVGVDIDPRCKEFEEERIHVCIGSQDDPQFLNKVVEQYGPFDIILDDGSHLAKHQIASFEILFPTLKERGTYICEDTHTSYKEYYNGKYKGNTFVEYSKNFVDSLNSQHVENENKKFLNSCSDSIRAVHFYDSMVVVEKKKRGESFDAWIGE